LKDKLYKRPLDLAIFLSAHIVLFPVWLSLWILIPLLIWFEDRGPVFYTQERVGRNGRVFRVYKFRSMVPDAEKQTGAVWASEHDPRVTKTGRILRATAMDELPQLWNILKGDMSFVGPRAERPELVEKFAKEIRNYRRRFEVRPGLTGVAQVYGRYDTPPRNKLRYDLLYVKNQSLLLDIKLILLSVWITLKGKWESRQKKV
jgi:lipopolysaccharide/colanic/teichoic acid biosynthesis glycosyltransferase